MTRMGSNTARAFTIDDFRLMIVCVSRITHHASRLLLLLLLAACRTDTGGNAAAAVPTAITPITLPSLTPTIPPTATTTPTLTPTFTATATGTPTPSATPTLTPSPIPSPNHPPANRAYYSCWQKLRHGPVWLWLSGGGGYPFHGRAARAGAPTVAGRGRRGK